MTDDHEAKLNRVRVSRFFEKKAEQNIKRFTVVCHVDDRPAIKNFVKTLNEKRNQKT